MSYATAEAPKATTGKVEKEQAMEGVARSFGRFLFITDMKGFEHETSPISGVSAGSLVVASITEVNSNDVPFQGAASMEVHNVVPMNQRPGEIGGRVRVRGFIGWERNVRARISLMVL